MTNPNLTDILAILDRSGSMNMVKKETEGAFDAYVAKQRDVPGDCNLSLVRFETEIDTVYRSKAIAEVPPLDLQPRGLTALYDAIGMTVVSFGEELERTPEEQRPGKVIVLILTDGQENASKEWTAARLKPLLKEQTEKYGWTILYLGANQDAVFEGEKIGIDYMSSITYDVGSMDVAVAAASEATTQSRLGNFRGFSDAERSAASGSDVALKSDGVQSTPLDTSLFTARDSFLGSSEARKKNVGWKPRSTR